jgi:hypothetical protein
MISEGLEQTTQWFSDVVNVQRRRIARLEDSLFWYRLGFWGVLLLLIGFVVGALLEN